MKFYLFLARLFGKVQGCIGRGQTHLLTLAQDRGWDPGEETKRMQLEMRQANIAARAIQRRMKRERKRALRKLPREKRKQFQQKAK